MNELDVNEKNVKGKNCLSVKWRSILIGFIYPETSGQWRISDDLRGEFWSLEVYSTQELAIEALVQKKQQLDDFRLSRISSQK
ncbi:MAG: hypothetical protein MK132_16880 [Lentisphaerales bacterium]|nr:hypothetical protein [Lentisphaerales bacterium]